MSDIHILGTAVAVIGVANFFAVRAIMKAIHLISDRVDRLEGMSPKA